MCTKRPCFQCIFDSGSVSWFLTVVLALVHLDLLLYILSLCYHSQGHFINICGAKAIYCFKLEKCKWEHLQAQELLWTSALSMQGLLCTHSSYTYVFIIYICKVTPTCGWHREPVDGCHSWVSLPKNVWLLLSQETREAALTLSMCRSAGILCGWKTKAVSRCRRICTCLIQELPKCTDPPSRVVTNPGEQPSWGSYCFMAGSRSRNLWLTHRGLQKAPPVCSCVVSVH